METWKSKYFYLIVSAAISAFLAVVATIYVQRFNEPRIVVEHAWGAFAPVNILSKPPAIALLALDLSTRNLIGENSIIVESADKSQLPDASNLKQSYYGLIAITNNGGVAASNIKTGLGYPLQNVEFNIKSSPNVEIVIHDKYPKETNQDRNIYYPRYMEIEIKKLRPKETAVLAIGWCLDKQHMNGIGQSPATKSSCTTNVGGGLELQNIYYLPAILYSNSSETVGVIKDQTQFNRIDALKNHDLYPFLRVETKICGFKSGSTITFRQFKNTETELYDPVSGLKITHEKY